MASIGITARFPLGVYHGHLSDGSPDPLPSPARLFSALVSAAHTGTSASADGEVAPDIAVALTWLEEHPPNGLLVPHFEPVASRTHGRVAYRDTGTVKNFASKVRSKPTSDGTFLAGAVGWSWDDMPDAVRDALTRLTEDVPCLGEAESLVVLEVRDIKPNWRLDLEASVFTPGGEWKTVASAGRRKALEAAYSQMRPVKPPSRAKDRQKANDSVMVFPVSDGFLREARYAPMKPERRTAPWRDVLVFPADDGMGRAFSPESRVSWSVAFHRALIRRIGDGAPAVITGRYPENLAIPANRFAIQYVPASLLLHSVAEKPLTPGAFLVMIPVEVSDAELGLVMDALAVLPYVNNPDYHARARLTQPEEILDAATFWSPPAAGTVRLWSPTPVAVPEVVKQRGRWTFEDAILLSLGFVWRDRLDAVERGARGYRSLVTQVRQHGAGVLWHQRLTRNPSAYAHRMPQGMVAQPYLAQIDTGDLSDDMTLLAIGQSRHLGGGLLVPVDMPADVVQAALRGPR